MFIYVTHSDNQSFLANTDCPVLLLLSHLRSKVGVPPNEAIDLCDQLGSPTMLFQVKTTQDRASDFLQARGTYYVCRVEFGAPEALRLHGQHLHQKLHLPKMLEGRKSRAAEKLSTSTRIQGV
ncbi:hypothetical protein ASZ78_006194, partial [Callipepla squamata]